MYEPQRDQERIRVWRPEGFTGVEVEMFENARDYLDPKGVLGEYHFNVNFRGSARVLYAGERRSFGYPRPLVMVQQPGEAYAADARGEPLTGWNLSLTEEAMRSLMDALELPGPPHFPEMTAPEGLNGTLADRLSDAIRAFDRPAARLERESRLLSVLHGFVRGLTDVSTAARQAGREHRAVRQVRETLHAHFADEVSLESLASLTGLSQGYLLLAFKQEVGVTPHAYQTGLRVARAKALLAQGVSLAQAASEIGFFDQSHLSHVFKKHVLVTPGHFRRESLGELANGRDLRVGAGPAV